MEIASCVKGRNERSGVMTEIKGKVNTAVCYAAVVEDEAIEQIRRMCDHDFTAGSGSGSCRMSTRAGAAPSAPP